MCPIQAHRYVIPGSSIRLFDDQAERLVIIISIRTGACAPGT